MSPRFRWQVLTAGICSLVLTIGLARFAYTPMLPLMKAQAGLDDALGGLLATVNYAGYMAGTLIATAVSAPATRLRLYRAGLLAGVIGVAGMGMTTDPWLWMILRFVAGVSAAGGMLLGSGMVLAWLVAQGRRPELGVHFAGLGLGIVVSGVLVLLMMAWPWDRQWLGMGVLAAVLLIPAWGWMPMMAPLARKAAEGPVRSGGGSGWLLVPAYFCAGVGFVVSATFLVAVTERVPDLRGTGPTVWVVTGLAAMPACILWDRVARRLGDIPALIAAYAVQIVSILLPVLSDGLIAALAGAVLFGATFIGIVAMTLALAGRQFPANPSQAMARLTLSYGVAQTIAPGITGFLADRSGSYNAGLIMAAVAMGVGVLMLAAMRTPKGA
ncbi:YbfB/YjiJ family MFS transporter [Novispirillum itersonii]|uniref:YbfB/YjiJ family MFS transporter n=1 Tax=Novispirillum itersonii TaxID=189 RepID=UPI00036A4042|nr:YbfB/YjiJ family MFS transporter [Novispirillum itersonii]